MSEQTDRIITGLTQFGLDADEAKIYLTLLQKSDMSALQISRQIGVARTKVYRLLDKLIEKGLVILKRDSGGFRFLAGDPSRMRDILREKEMLMKKMEDSLPNLVESLTGLERGKDSSSKVLYYQGRRGLSQINWNLLNAKGVVRSMEIATADAYLPQVEAEKLRQELVDKKITMRTLTNNIKVKPFTKVKDMARKYWELRCVPKNILNIKMDIFIYNDVYAWCDYRGGDNVFCVEVQNQNLVDIQLQVFEDIWKLSTPMKIIGDSGQAEVAK